MIPPPARAALNRHTTKDAQMSSDHLQGSVLTLVWIMSYLKDDVKSPRSELTTRVSFSFIFKTINVCVKNAQVLKVRYPADIPSFSCC